MSDAQRVSAADIAAARARPIAEVVGAATVLKHDFGLCVFHPERTPSLHVDRKRNVFCCFGCGAKGDPITFVQRYRGLAFADAVASLCGSALGSPGRPGRSGNRPALARQVAPQASTPAEHLLRKIHALWAAATDPDLARFYLVSRHIAQKRLPGALRGHPRVWNAETRTHRPAVLAALTAPDGAVCAIQRVWVEDRLVYDGKTEYPKGTRSSDLAAGKMTWGRMAASAVRLAAAGETLGIAEGFETALAATRLFKIPTWSACGASRLGAVELPEIVRQVVIFGDNGAAGEAFATKAESAYRQRGYAAQTVFPDPWCGDFAEQVMKA